MVAVAGLLRILLSVWGGADRFEFFGYILFQNRARRVHDRCLREIQSSHRRLGEGATTDQSAHRQLVPIYPHNVYHLFCYQGKYFDYSVIS